MKRGDYYMTDKIVQKGWQYTIVTPKPETLAFSNQDKFFSN